MLNRNWNQDDADLPEMPGRTFPGPDAPPDAGPTPPPTIPEPEIVEPGGGGGGGRPRRAGPSVEMGMGGPPPSMAEQLVSAQGLGGTFQRAGTEGAVPFRTPDFFRARQTAAPELAGSVGAGTPFVGGAPAAGGERDDEGAVFKAMRRLRTFR